MRLFRLWGDKGMVTLMTSVLKELKESRTSFSCETLHAMAKNIILSIVVWVSIVPLNLYGQRDTLVHKDKYVIYITDTLRSLDTLNRVDKMGFKQGLWIEYDSSQYYSCLTRMDCVYKNGKYDHVCTTQKSGPFLFYDIKWKGYYIDNKKQGLWVDSYTHQDSRKELFYKDGMLQSPVLYYLRGHLDAYAEYNDLQKHWRIIRYDEFGNIAIEFTHENIQFILDF